MAVGVPDVAGNQGATNTGVVFARVFDRDVVDTDVVEGAVALRGFHQHTVLTGRARGVGTGSADMAAKHRHIGGILDVEAAPVGFDGNKTDVAAVGVLYRYRTVPIRADDPTDIHVTGAARTRADADRVPLTCRCRRFRRSAC